MGEGLVDALIAYLDTNVVVWLSQGNRKHISDKAKKVVARADLLISPMVLLELEYLFELRRTNFSSRDLHLKVEREVNVRVCELSFAAVANAALDEKWTRDPFDRVIVAHAKANGFAQLVSADEAIAKHYPRTVW